MWSASSLAPPAELLSAVSHRDGGNEGGVWATLREGS